MAPTPPPPASARRGGDITGTAEAPRAPPPKRFSKRKAAEAGLPSDGAATSASFEAGANQTELGAAGAADETLKPPDFFLWENDGSEKSSGGGEKPSGGGGAGGGKNPIGSGGGKAVRINLTDGITPLISQPYADLGSIAVYQFEACGHGPGLAIQSLGKFDAYNPIDAQYAWEDGAAAGKRRCLFKYPRKQGWHECQPMMDKESTGLSSSENLAYQIGWAPHRSLDSNACLVAFNLRYMIMPWAMGRTACLKRQLGAIRSQYGLVRDDDATRMMTGGWYYLTAPFASARVCELLVLPPEATLTEEQLVALAAQPKRLEGLDLLSGGELDLRKLHARCFDDNTFEIKLITPRLLVALNQARRGATAPPRTPAAPRRAPAVAARRPRGCRPTRAHPPPPTPRRTGTAGSTTTSSTGRR